MAERLLIYYQNTIDTYLYFVKENLALIRRIYGEAEQPREPYDPTRRWILYVARAKHLQVMILIGVTAEHLIKILLLKRGFVLNTSDIEAKFRQTFMQELEEQNQTELDRDRLDELYSNAVENLSISFKRNLKQFDECIRMFNKSNPQGYYDPVRTYELNPHPERYNEDSYLGYKRIRPEQVLAVIQKMRNSYLHLAEAQAEQNGVIWYLFNFLIWLCKKEYPVFFETETMLGGEGGQRLFGT
jgi:hypothetical protein